AGPDPLERQLQLYREALTEAGKPFPAELPMRRELYVARTREEAWRTCGPYLEGKYRTYSAWGQDKVVPEEAGFRLDFDELADERFLIGDPDHCVDGLRRAATMCAMTVLLRGHAPGSPSAAPPPRVQPLARPV